MNAKQLLINAAVTGLLFNTALAKESVKVETKEIVMGKCSGINSCKGQGDCHSKSNTCASQNSCKGKGWVKKDKKSCLEEKGTFEEN